MSTDEKNHSSQDTSAADEPTAMWDASALKDLGLEEAAKTHEDASPKAPLAAPVTKPVVPTRPRTVPKKGKGGGGLSWPMLAVVAIALGLVVYFGVSLLLG